MSSGEDLYGTTLHLPQDLNKKSYHTVDLTLNYTVEFTLKPFLTGSDLDLIFA